MTNCVAAPGQVRLSDAEVHDILKAITIASEKSGVRWELVAIFGSRTDLSKKGGDIDLYVKVDSTTSADSVYVLKQKFRMELCDRLGNQKFDLVIDNALDPSTFIKSIVIPEKVDLWLNQ